jgi:hypothetical protein
MQNGREMQSTELEVRRRSEGYGCCRSSRSVSSTAAKRLSSTEFISHKNRRKRALLGTALDATRLYYKRNCSSFEDLREL